MRIHAIVLTATILGTAPAHAQNPSDSELAHLLASDKTRQATAERIGDSGGEKIPLLLSWAKTPPSGIDEHELYVGLADVFARTKTKEATPFLVKNINLRRFNYGYNNFWKTAPQIELCLPAAAALIQIGPEASRAVMRAAWDMSVEDYHVAVFVVSRIKNVPEARVFLLSVQAQANAENYWAEEGIKFAEKDKQSK
jgi:hypothetical protein